MTKYNTTHVWPGLVIVTVALIALWLTSCSAVKSTHQVAVSPATRALILAQPEFTAVDCGAARITVVGADVTKGGLLLSINCVEF